MGLAVIGEAQVPVEVEIAFRDEGQTAGSVTGAVGRAHGDFHGLYPVNWSGLRPVGQDDLGRIPKVVCVGFQVALPSINAESESVVVPAVA